MIAFGCFTLAACSQGGGSNGFAAIGALGNPHAVIAGVVSKGPVAGAQVCAKAIDPAGTPQSQIGTCVQTDSAGAYSLDLGTYAGAVLLTATHGTYTDEASGVPVTLDASAGTTGLHSAISAVASGPNTAAITPLTEVAYQVAMQSRGLNSGGILAAQTLVQTNFSVPDIVGVLPIDALHVPANPDPKALAYALAQATISQYVLDQSGSGVTLASALSTLTACLATQASSSCGSGSSSLGIALMAAQTHFTAAAGHPGYASIALNLATFGTTSGSGSGSTGSSGLPLNLLAGSSIGSGTVLDGPASVALIPDPASVTVDAAGNVYVADSFSATIRKVSVQGSVTTIAGVAGSHGYGDGPGASAQFSSPSAIAFGAACNCLYVSDTANNVIRSVSLSDNTVSTFAGLAGNNSPVTVVGGAVQSGDGAYATFNTPGALAVDGSGNVWVHDISGYSFIREITPTPGGPTPSNTTTIAGGNSWSYARQHVTDFDGQGFSAGFYYPSGLAYDAASGNILVADTYDNAIRSITPAGMVTTLVAASGAYLATSTTTTSPGTRDTPTYVFALNTPKGIAADGNGNVFVVDGTGAIDAFSAGNGAVTLAPAGTVSGPAGAAWSAAGQLIVSDTSRYDIAALAPTGGPLSNLAGFTSQGSADGTGVAGKFTFPYGLCFDAAGNAIVMDQGNYEIRRVTPTGAVTTLAGSPANAYGFSVGSGAAAQLGVVQGPSFDAASGKVAFADTYNHVIETIDLSTGTVAVLAGPPPGDPNASQPGFVDSATGVPAQFYSPAAVAADGTGNIYVADTSNNAIRKIAANGVVTTVAGPPPGSANAGQAGFADGAGLTAAMFNAPSGIAADGFGNLYVADSGNNAIRKIDASGNVTTLAGPLPGSASAGQSGYADGTGAAALFTNPTALTTDASGNAYLIDQTGQQIRKVTPTGAVSSIAVQSGNAQGLPVIRTSPTGIAMFGRNLYLTSGNGVVYLANVP